MIGFIEVGAVDQQKSMVNAAYIDANNIVSFASYEYKRGEQLAFGTMILFVATNGKEYATLAEENVFTVAAKVETARSQAQRERAGSYVAAFLDAVPDIDAVFKALKP
jgi:hypothetical protein